MTDYSTLTDAEINERVALVCGWKWRRGAYEHSSLPITLEHAAWATSLNAVFGPHGPAEWLRAHNRDIPNREARAFCEAFLAVVEAEGVSCDVCNDYILLEPISNPFSIFGVRGLHAHQRCKELILALDTNSPRFWDALPHGRVRQLADDINERDLAVVEQE